MINILILILQILKTQPYVLSLSFYQLSKDIFYTNFFMPPYILVKT